MRILSRFALRTVVTCGLLGVSLGTVPLACHVAHAATPKWGINCVTTWTGYDSSVGEHVAFHYNACIQQVSTDVWFDSPDSSDAPLAWIVENGQMGNKGGSQYGASTTSTRYVPVNCGSTYQGYGAYSHNTFVGPGILGGVYAPSSGTVGPFC